MDRYTPGEDTNVLKAFRQMQAEDRWSIMGNMKPETCPVCWKHMKHWLLHVISECRGQRILPIWKELEELAGGPLSDNDAEWVKETGNRFEPHTTSIVGQLILQWTDERKTDTAGHQEEPEDLEE